MNILKQYKTGRQAERKWELRNWGWFSGTDERGRLANDRKMSIGIERDSVYVPLGISVKGRPFLFFLNLNTDLFVGQN
jgi:hypothetical protein